MQRNKIEYQRIAELPLTTREREQALTNLRAAEAFIDSLVVVAQAGRRAIEAVERFGRGLYRQLKAS